MTPEQIQQTNHYKSITDKTIQGILLTLDFRKQIRHGIEVTKNVNFDTWLSISKPGHNVKEIVRELTNN